MARGLGAVKKPDAQEVRALLALEPQLQKLAETLRAHFGAKLVGLYVHGGADHALRDIGWSAYRDSVKHAITWEGSANWFQDAKAEWKRIKAETIQAGDRARRSPTARQSGVVR